MNRYICVLLKLPRISLFHMKTRVCFKYSVNDCRFFPAFVKKELNSCAIFFLIKWIYFSFNLLSPQHFTTAEIVTWVGLSYYFEVLFLHSFICWKHFLSSYISGGKPWDSLVFVQKEFRNYCTASYFLNLREVMENC